jgi:hypothetical protein
MARRERATPGIRCANASLTGLKAGRVRQPARADRHGRTARTVGRARTSRRLAQEPATETGRSAVFATRAAMVDRSANASLNGPRAGRAPKPARADRRDPTPGMVGRANVGSTAQMQSVMATADPARERKFDRPQGRPRTQAGEGRPQRSGDKNRGPRSDFKPPRAGGRDGDRPRSAGRGPGSEGGPPRGRSSPERRPRPPGKGPPKGGGGPRRSPRKS